MVIQSDARTLRIPPPPSPNPEHTDRQMCNKSTSVKKNKKNHTLERKDDSQTFILIQHYSTAKFISKAKQYSRVKFDSVNVAHVIFCRMKTGKKWSRVSERKRKAYFVLPH